jgi:FkbM family methyltransferase
MLAEPGRAGLHVEEFAAEAGRLAADQPFDDGDDRGKPHQVEKNRMHPVRHRDRRKLSALGVRLRHRHGHDATDRGVGNQIFFQVESAVPIARKRIAGIVPHAMANRDLHARKLQQALILLDEFRAAQPPQDRVVALTAAPRIRQRLTRRARIIRARLRSCARREYRAARAPLPASTILRLLGDRPIGFVDIGARGGMHPLVEPIAPAVAVLGFEPDAAECERIRRDAARSRRFARVEIEAAALSDAAGAAILHHVSAPTNSSLRAPNPLFVSRYGMTKWQEVGLSSLETTTLDEVLFARRAAETDWGEAAKIDTQGTEYEILKGAPRTLRERTLFLCVEVSFCELYDGQKLFSDVELLLRDAGFSFYGFDRLFNRSRKTLDKRSHWGKERTIQADAYFFKDPFDAPEIRRDLSPRALVVLAVFALMTGYHDFAIELLDRIGDDAGELRRHVSARATMSAAASRAEAQKLVRAVEARPDDANILIGKFVDERRGRNDYFDIDEATRMPGSP